MKKIVCTAGTVCMALLAFAETVAKSSVPSVLGEADVVVVGGTPRRVGKPAH